MNIKLLKAWLPWALIVTGLCALVAFSFYRDIRQSANDIQVQLSEDAAVALQQGQRPEHIVSQTVVDISQSLAPFVIIYDDKANPIASSGQLNGKTPTPPVGVFEFTREHGQDRITWQPQPETRIAMVMVHYGGSEPGFVLAGRNLREVEARARTMGIQVVIAWVLLMAVTGGLILMTRKKQA